MKVTFIVTTSRSIAPAPTRHATRTGHRDPRAVFSVASQQSKASARRTDGVLRGVVQKVLPADVPNAAQTAVHCGRQPSGPTAGVAGEGCDCFAYPQAAFMKRGLAEQQATCVERWESRRAPEVNRTIASTWKTAARARAHANTAPSSSVSQASNSDASTTESVLLVRRGLGSVEGSRCYCQQPRRCQLRGKP